MDTACQATAEARFDAIFGTRTRFVLVVVVLLCLTSIWSNILTFQFAVICMEPEELDDINGTEWTSSDNMTSSSETYTFTSNQKSWAISIVAITALVGNFPIVQLINRVGIRTVFASLGVLSAVVTLLMPLAIRMGFAYFLIARGFQGLAFAANFPVIGSFCAKWAYYKQNGLFVSALVAYVQLAPALTMPISGALCGAFKWSSVFYAHGAFSLVIFIIYYFLYRNSPHKHPLVGSVELGKIQRNKTITDKKSVQRVPYMAIIRTPAVWAVWLASIGNFTCVNMMFLFSPVYLSKVLGMSVHSTGISAALPPFAQFLAKLIFGGISDRIKFISETNKFRLFNSIAFVGSSIFLIVLFFMGDKNTNMNYLVFGAAAGLLGATTGGFFKSGPVISQQYSHFVTGNISLGITITMLIIPFIVNGLTPNNTQDEWRWVFLIVAGVMLATNTFFCFFIKGEACAWTKEDNRTTSHRIADCSISNGVQMKI